VTTTSAPSEFAAENKRKLFAFVAIALVSWSAFADSVLGMDGEDGIEQVFGAVIGSLRSARKAAEVFESRLAVRCNCDTGNAMAK